MFRRNLHRGITAVVFAAALLLAGARPAAAEGFGWREAWDWIGRLWGGITVLQAVPQADCGPEIDPNGCPKTGTAPEPDPVPQGDCGLEIDPLGKCRD